MYKENVFVRCTHKQLAKSFCQCQATPRECFLTLSAPRNCSQCHTDLQSRFAGRYGQQLSTQTIRLNRQHTAYIRCHRAARRPAMTVDMVWVQLSPKLKVSLQINTKLLVVTYYWMMKTTPMYPDGFLLRLVPFTGYKNYENVVDHMLWPSLFLENWTPDTMVDGGRLSPPPSPKHQMRGLSVGRMGWHPTSRVQKAY